MARTRARQAHDAFSRVGTAPVSPVADDSASIPAGSNDDISASGNTGEVAGEVAGGTAREPGGRKAGGPAGRTAARRVGRPRGPDRVALTVRILAATDARLTAAVEATGQSPQYVVDAALAAYLDTLGV
jgi:hypothetical protein